MSGEIRLNREEMDQIVQIFQTQSQAMSDMLNDVKNKYSNLYENKNFEGDAAEKFSEEMQSLLFPAMGRLIDVLNQSAQTANQVNQILTAAEEESGGLFSNMSI